MSAKFSTSGTSTAVKQVMYVDSAASNAKSECYKIVDQNGNVLWCKPYTFSYSKGTGVASISVIRTSSLEPSISVAENGDNLADGDTVYYGDTIQIKANASTGYSINGTYPVTIIVTDKEDTHTFTAGATINQHTLSIHIFRDNKETTASAQKITTKITVSGTTTTNESSDYSKTFDYGTQYSLSDAYYNVDSVKNKFLKLDTALPISGSLPDSDKSLDLYFTTVSHTLTITKDTGVSTITVTRNTSPYGGGATGALSTGDTIYYGDTLSVSATPSTGYRMDSGSADGGTYTYDITVGEDDITVEPECSVRSFTATLNGNSHSTISLVVVSSPLNGTVKTYDYAATLSPTVYYNDVVYYVVKADSGYKIAILHYSSDHETQWYTYESTYTSPSMTITRDISYTPVLRPYLKAPSCVSSSGSYTSSSGSVTSVISNYNSIAVTAHYSISSSEGYFQWTTQEGIPSYPYTETVTHTAQSRDIYIGAGSTMSLYIVDGSYPYYTLTFTAYFSPASSSDSNYLSSDSSTIAPNIYTPSSSQTS